ncbi:ferric reductase-like transmembrane domain-containing protein [Nocardia sp. alder85J]|uniref:ferric reductase-like transmembrane domain-containing protein n=1 Tax=Nocardia sp. alder85J TaxID=2862949 RepID=UPI001CD7416C|nr:ferric reductase-like transmembrane domain-containing protein [Nocardia sp. alder85J]MCX4095802.1 ferric reductase-like transmembrane domain-containing protein [Nocardia sp. alder85J]
MTRPGLDEALWAFGRGTGLVALVLLTVALVAGIAARSGRAVVLPRAGLAEFHRGAALSATILVAVHVASLLADPRAQLRLLDVIVPFTAAYRPLWVGLGTVAVDLLTAITLSALLRKRLGPRIFRATHWATYLLWPVAFVHALGSGSDNTQPWLLAVVAACALSLALAVVWRAGRDFAEYSQPPGRNTR